MKKLYFFLFALLLMTPAVVFGQEPVTDLPVTFDFQTYVSSFSLFAGTVLFITGLISGLIKEGSWAFNNKQYLSWIIAGILALIATLLGWGIFADASWWQTALYALFFVLGANGIYDWALIQELRKGIGLK